MSAVESRLAATLAKHQRFGHTYSCSCGWEWPEEPTWACGEEERFERDLVAHVAAVIASADDLAVIELQLLDDLTDPDPCEWDHNHSCQAHGYYYLPQGVKCPNAEAAEIVAAKAAEAAEAVTRDGE